MTLLNYPLVVQGIPESVGSVNRSDLRKLCDMFELMSFTSYEPTAGTPLSETRRDKVKIHLLPSYLYPQIVST